MTPVPDETAPTILVVDDEEHITELLSMGLAMIGFADLELDEEPARCGGAGGRST